MARSNRWCFTINNYTEEEFQRLRTLDVKYLVAGREVGEQGTPHIQGFVIFKKRFVLNKVKDQIGERAHLEVARGKNSEAAEYCKKDGAYFEVGELPPDRGQAGGEATKRKWEDAYDAAAKGDFDAIPREMFIKYRKNFREIYQEELNRNTLAIGDWDLKKHFIWIYGPTGTGKSHLARSLAMTLDPEHPPYLKGLNKWWSGYQQQRCVIIEEASPESCKYLAPLFKQWCDKWPFTAETKGGSFEHGIRPEYIFITSNYPIEDCFTEDNDRLPMLRRCYQFHKETREAWLPFDLEEDRMLATQVIPPSPLQQISTQAEVEIEEEGSVDSEDAAILKVAEHL